MKSQCGISSLLLNYFLVKKKISQTELKKHSRYQWHTCLGRTQSYSGRKSLSALRNMHWKNSTGGSNFNRVIYNSFHNYTTIKKMHAILNIFENFNYKELLRHSWKRIVGKSKKWNLLLYRVRVCLASQ